MKDGVIDEKRVTEIVLTELNQYIEVIGSAIAHAIAVHNAKLADQFKEMGIVK